MNRTCDLAGKVVLVTGAAKRMGRSIAQRLAQEGARVLIHYHTSQKEAEQTAAECNAAGLFRADLAQVPQIVSMFQDIQAQCGRLDGLVNNAARFTRFHPFEITEADWDFIHNVNLKAVFFCCQQGGKLMRKHGGGRIVNISSLGGIRPWAEHAHYCASKAGVIHLTKALAKALAPDITVNSVAPGVFPFGNMDRRIEEMITRTPAGRAGEGEEIADAVVYFLKATNFVTGQLLVVDGGLELC
ncbi:MAG: SDR family oxidoreductase [Bryobacteraceae bacterium]|nr:SDR family oxidoreductase [Bryobacteraceae bacterium]MDW8379683.1 SDR family NAD(P)-dependent oxidoreductase [Bryobacterales bacterium]